MAAISSASRHTGARRLAPVGASTLACLALAGCGGVLSPRGPIGDSEATILLNSLGIMLAIVVPTIVVTLGVAFWFRASNTRARYLPTWEYSGKVEMVVWSIPLMTVLLLAGICWIGSHELDPPRPIASSTRPLDVDVVSLDWKWLFIYPDLGVASVNRLVIPTGTPVSFRITSATVFNSFFIPQLGGQIYAMGGMQTRLNLLADKPGIYLGRSVQFSGDGFSGMQFETVAMPQARFADWLTNTRATGKVLDAAAYAVLARESEDVAPFTYRGVTPNLFDAILMQAAPRAQAMPIGEPDRSVEPASVNEPEAAPAGHGLGPSQREQPLPPTQQHP